MGTPGIDQWVLHVDLDQFIAAVEVLRNPELAGRPVVVGGRGDPTERGVVSTASYEARAHGVGSGMPLRVAARKIPDAVFLPVDADTYNEVSQVVMDTLRGFGTVVDVLGWDEAFMGVQTSDPEAFAREVQAAVLDATGLHCSVGIGDNVLRAKIATGFGKPRGIFRLTRDNWFAVMGERSPDSLWGIGSRTVKKLDDMGIRTVRELASAPVDEMAARFGPKIGPWLVGLGAGAGSTEVSAEPWVARSRSRETTFQHNVGDWNAITECVRDLAARAVDDIRGERREGVRVALKIRYAPFVTHTASVALPSPTTDLATVTEAAVGLLDRFDHEREVRLVGVRVEMTPPENVRSQ
ncbi:DNA polymerase-4 [Rhodococcus pyridinivorans]|uniref:DNA polymerase IV n=1 Tax=Rhodococcus pyridinivorans TaxID=103816 RepID=UPI0007CD56A8|nr:DNA polymerase IV [Rhodococcus pyridinivorans]QXF80855.1 DNA polymerase IV [Rhodococcus pyridinivorans]SED32503.1 DNA polymerase-4 [Rhodococcus pyridinivorans]